MLYKFKTLIMKYVYKRISQFPKKHKASRVRIEHYLGKQIYLQVVFYGIDVPAALDKFKSLLDLKIGYITISALYGESRLCEMTLRVSELLDNYAAREMLLY